jgi:beta-glucosidase
MPVSDLAFWDVTRGRFVVESAPHQLMVGRSATDIRLSARFEVEGETIPPQSGLLHAAAHDEYDAITFVDETKADGDAVRSDAEGAWILFRQVDLTGATTCVVTAGSTEGGMITVRRGDPLYGQALASFPVPRTDRYIYHAITASLAAADRVHDVYVVFENDGVTLSRLEFGAGA